MKKILILLMIIVTNIFAEDLYVSDRIIKMELNFYDENYLYLLVKNKESKTEIPAQLIVDDTVIFDSVGVRYKGNSSYNVKSIKKSFNVSIDAYDPNQKLFGYKTLNLNNCFVDPTFMREKITTDIYSKYMPTIKSGYVYLYVNGEEYGLYSNIQQLNKDFLGEWYSSKSGNLYKGDPRGDLTWKGDNPASYKKYYEKKTNEEEDDWTDLIALIDIINNSADLENDLPAVLNTDRVLWYFALCNAFVNLDSYIFSAHNYYLYNNPSTSTFEMLVWDMNESFGVFPPSLPFKKEEFPPVDLNIPNRIPLFKKMLSKQSFANVYYAHYRTILKEYFNEDSISAMIGRIKPLIEESVRKDPIKLYTYEDFQTNIVTDVIVDNRKVPGLVSFVSKRNKFLKSLPEFSYKSPEIENVECITEELIPGENAIFNSTVRDENVTKVSLNFRFGKDNFHAIQMYDDGKHKDGQAGDYVYGVVIVIPENTTAETIDYYITAVNDHNVMKFEPERAEFEFLSENIIRNDNIGDVVINEFMASNQTTIQDPQGSYADWIELYNRTNKDINLNGWYLTDDPDEGTKWQFPDVVIKANDYLLIWADKDIEDEGLHTNFKLSKTGEYIGLLNENIELIDSYIFGEQTTDVSEGRYPNGNGAFVFMEYPTPLAKNILSTDVKYRPLAEVHITPNPVGDYISIKSSETFKNIEIYNVLGLQMLKLNYKSVVNISFLAPGIYFIKLYNNNTVITKKILKIK